MEIRHTEAPLDSTSTVPPPRPQPPTVVEYVRALRARLWALHALRGLALGLGIGAVALIVAAQLSAPVLTHRTALWVLAAMLGVGAIGMAIALVPMRNYLGTRIAQHLALIAPGLDSRLRSALEMASTRDGHESPDLVRAHVARVERELSALPPQRVAPNSLLAHHTVAFGASLLGLACLLMLSDPRLVGFMHSLLAPAPERADGTRVAPVVRHLSAKLTFPSYLNREAVTLTDPSVIDAPRGTSVELTVEPVFPVDRGSLHVGDRASALTLGSNGQLTARITAHQSARLLVQLEGGGVRYEDTRGRRIDVTADAKPKISIESPASGTLAELGELITVRFSATDDGGLAYVDLHIRLTDGTVIDRRVWSAQDDKGLRADLRASTGLTPSELGVREGDAFVIWLAARDGDMVTGPNIGTSEEVTIEVTSPRQRIASFVPRLQAATDAGVRLLGDRLEHGPPEDVTAATTRFTAVAATTRDFMAKLDEVVASVLASEEKHALDVDQLRGIKRRVQRLLESESQQHASPMRPHAERADHDARTIEEIERDVILLADLLAKAHIDEAGAIAQDLRDLKKRIEELLKKLGDANSPEAEREILAEIARAQQRLAELQQSLSRMATRVPSEFVNREALKTPETQQTLQDLQGAIKKHDLKAAAEQLDALAKQIDDLASQLAEGGMRVRESRFGPRDQAMAAARQQLDMIGAEQQRLAGRSQDVMQDAMSRSGAPENNSAQAKSLAEQASAIRRELDKLERNAMPSWQGEATERAQERLRDAQDALAQGDLAAARNATQGAQQDLQTAANDMENDARMFPGQQGETARNAQHARKAANDTSQLAQQIAESMPDLSKGMTPGDKQRLQQDVEPQRKTADATDQLRETFENGPGGMPLSPEGAETLKQARDAMQRAQKALQKGRADDAAREQADAAEKLDKLSKKLAKQQQPQSGEGKDGGEQESADGKDMSKEPVRIHEADEFQGPLERRRKLLDAMREASPRGFEAAVQRYYQELLR
jgi:Domain of unknown function (DUF4175)